MLVRRFPRQGFALFAAGLALALSAIPVLATGDPTATPGNGPAAIAITVRTCAAGYDPAKDGADPKTDCKEPAAGDTNFIVSQGDRRGPSASTGTSGSAPQESTVSFTGMTPGRYTISTEAPAEIGGAFIATCASTTRELTSPFVPLATANAAGAVTLDLQPGESLTCDWYQVLGDNSGA
jgi:hypothetical protein